MMNQKPIRWSSLRHLRQSAQHYRYFLEHGTDETPAMRIGSIVHGIILGSQHSFVIYEEARRGNAWKEFKAAHEGKRIITREEFDRGYEISKSVLANADARLLCKGAKERTISWSIDGRECSGTPDFAGNDLGELKITADARPEKLPWQAQRMGWLGQLEWYAHGLAAAGFQAPEQVQVIAVEPKPPYPVVVYNLTEAAREAGKRTWRLLWEQLMACERSDRWPGYCESVVPLDVNEQELELVIDGEEVAL